jgi:RNA polymerase sigma-70 factor (ECF subfamily)
MLEDLDIVRRCQEGQTDLMEILIDRHQTALYSLCRKLARDPDDADDLFQDTWVKVMKNLDKFTPQHKFITWVFSICVNLYRDRYRKRKRWLWRVKRYDSEEEQQRAMEAAGSGDSAPDRQVLQNETKAQVRRAMDRLDDAYRIPIILHYFRGLTISEIAGIMKVPDGTVKTRLVRGREKLGTLVEEASHA